MWSSLCLLLALFVQVFANNDDIPTFKIDLDLPARQRWLKVGKRYRRWFRDNHQKMELTIANKYWTQELEDELFAAVSDEIREELEGLIEGLNHEEATLAKYLKQAVVYELGLTEGFECSGIVATKSDGTTIHGRNLDLGAQFKFVEKITFYAEFVKNGQPIAKGVTFLGNVGIHTGVHLGEGTNKWTIEQNTRIEGKRELRNDTHLEIGNHTHWEVHADPQGWVNRTISALRSGGKLMHQETRRLLIETDSFTDAVDKFSTTGWIAPQYFILAGAGQYEGAVITVGRVNSAGEAGFYDIQLMSESSGQWVLIQTNDDHWDDPLDLRREHARITMKMLKEKSGVCEDNVMISLRSPPTCNDRTLFSWVRNPSSGEEQLDMGDCDGQGLFASE